MNPDTGHLIRFRENAPMVLGYAPIPENLREEADRELTGGDDTYVDLNSRSPLSQWARDERKRKRKQAKESRRRNRK